MEYDPIATKHEQWADGYSVLVEDKNGNYPSVWFDMWITSVCRELTGDWNMYIFNLWNPEHVKIKDFQENADNFISVFECAEYYLADNGLLIQNDDYTWTFPRLIA